MKQERKNNKTPTYRSGGFNKEIIILIITLYLFRCGFIKFSIANDNFLPFMILPIYSVLSKLDGSMIEAAQDLGGDAFTVFRRIILPLSLPGVASGITMVFMPAVSTFVISRLLGGGQFMLIGNLIEQQFLSSGDWGFGSALSVLMMLLILLSMGIMQRHEPEREGGMLW